MENLEVSLKQSAICDPKTDEYCEARILSIQREDGKEVNIYKYEIRDGVISLMINPDTNLRRLALKKYILDHGKVHKKKELSFQDKVILLENLLEDKISNLDLYDAAFKEAKTVGEASLYYWYMQIKHFRKTNNDVVLDMIKNKGIRNIILETAKSYQNGDLKFNSYLKINLIKNVLNNYDIIRVHGLKELDQIFYRCESEEDVDFYCIWNKLKKILNSNQFPKARISTLLTKINEDSTGIYKIKKG